MHLYMWNRESPLDHSPLPGETIFGSGPYLLLVVASSIDEARRVVGRFVQDEIDQLESFGISFSLHSVSHLSITSGPVFKTADEQNQWRKKLEQEQAEEQAGSEQKRREQLDQYEKSRKLRASANRFCDLPHVNPSSVTTNPDRMFVYTHTPVETSPQWVEDIKSAQVIVFLDTGEDD